MDADNELLENLDRLHTTELGALRIKKNLSLEAEDVVGWYRTEIRSPNAAITRKGEELVCGGTRLYHNSKCL